MVDSGTPAVCPSQRWGFSQSLPTAFGRWWSILNGFELQVPGELAGYGSPQLLVTAATLNSAGGAVSVDIFKRAVWERGKTQRGQFCFVMMPANEPLV